MPRIAKSIYFDPELIDWWSNRDFSLEDFCNIALKAVRDADLEPNQCGPFFYLRTFLGPELAEVVQHWQSLPPTAHQIIVAAARVTRARLPAAV